MQKIAFFILFLVFGALGVCAQTNVEGTDFQSGIETEDPIDRSFYMDEEEKICYIDLEKIPVNLKQAAIINNDGDEVVVKSLTQERVDTIVELDYSELPRGQYVLELRSYRGTTVKAIQL